MSESISSHRREPHLRRSAVGLVDGRVSANELRDDDEEGVESADKTRIRGEVSGGESSDEFIASRIAKQEEPPRAPVEGSRLGQELRGHGDGQVSFNHV